MLHIPSKEAKVFVTNTKAPYLISIELFDPLEILSEPLLLDFNQESLPAPPESLCPEKVMPNPSLFILGTVPRNLVNLKLLRKKHAKKKEEMKEITIANSAKNKTAMEKMRSQKLFQEQADSFPHRRQKSDMGSSPKQARSKRKYTSNNAHKSSDESISPLDASIDPVLVTENDIVTADVIVGSGGEHKRKEGSEREERVCEARE